MGAVFFVEVFARYRGIDVDKKVFSCHHEDNRDLISLRDLRRILFHEKKVLEHGCGTGLCSLALLKVADTVDTSVRDKVSSASMMYQSSFVTLTDGDDDVLVLSQRNAITNKLDHTVVGR